MLSAISSFDLAVTSAVYSLVSSSSILAALAIFFAQWLPYCAILFLVVHEFLVDEDERTFIPDRLRRIAYPVLVVSIVVFGLKLLIHEPRPFVGELGIIPLVTVVDPFSSFPSAHAAVFAALFSALWVFGAPFWKWYAGIAVAIGLGRIMTGVHWSSDVLVGFLIGFVIAFGWGKILLYRKGKNI